MCPPSSATTCVQHAEKSAQGPATCDTCGMTVKRKYDLPRHKAVHEKNKKGSLYRCDFPGCVYAALQKSNLKTHKGVHTGEKKLKCPDKISVTLPSGEVRTVDCPFKTNDPASRTRHRKVKHGYQPKADKLNKVRKPKIVDEMQYLPVPIKQEVSPPLASPSFPEWYEGEPVAPSSSQESSLFTSCSNVFGLGNLTVPAFPTNFSAQLPSAFASFQEMPSLYPPVREIPPTSSMFEAPLYGPEFSMTLGQYGVDGFDVPTSTFGMNHLNSFDTSSGSFGCLPSSSYIPNDNNEFFFGGINTEYFGVQQQQGAPALFNIPQWNEPIITSPSSSMNSSPRDSPCPVPGPQPPLYPQAAVPDPDPAVDPFAFLF